MPDAEVGRDLLQVARPHYGLYGQSEMDTQAVLPVEEDQRQLHPKWLGVEGRWMDAAAVIRWEEEIWPAHLTQEALQVAGASGVGGLSKMLADAIVAFQQGSITPRVAATEV